MSDVVNIKTIMWNIFIVITFLLCALFVVGCTTPTTVLKNEKTGQVVTCGGSANGSLAGGVIGYHIQKSNDDECVNNFIGEGFATVGRKE